MHFISGIEQANMDLLTAPASIEMTTQDRCAGQQLRNERRRKVTIVGAGMSGCMVAIFLAKRNFKVEVYERRGDLRSGFVEPNRSLNMTLSQRGLSILEEVGLVDQILPLCVPVRGRLVHDLDGSERFHSYGEEEQERLHAIGRSDLNAALLTAAETYPQIKIFFNKTFLRIDETGRQAYFSNKDSAETQVAESDFIVGADGAFSTVREAIHRRENADYNQQYLDWSYKEIQIPPAEDGSWQIEPHALHLWPRGDCMMMALPNLNGSFNCICSMPSKGDPSFSSLGTQEASRAFFAKRFPQVLSLNPSVVGDFLRNPVSTFLTIKTVPWHHRDRVVLVGDAAHTVVPFYGQGMISAFEDCSMLDRCLIQHGDDLQRAFSRFQEIRKPNTDTLAAISVSNFVELRDKIRDPRLIARKHLEGYLHRLFPRAWKPIYGMIAHSNTPYADALARYRKQQRIARWFGYGLLIEAGALMIRLGRLGGSLTRFSRRQSARPDSTTVTEPRASSTPRLPNLTDPGE